MNLGEIIKNYRNENNLSMQAFADRCNLSKPYIAMLERNINNKTGEPVVPSIETFIRVANAMNVPLSKLLENIDENQPVSLTEVPAKVINQLEDLAKAKVQRDQLLGYFNQLNDDGKEAAVRQVRLLTMMEEFKT